MICASLALLQIMFAVHRFAQGATAVEDAFKFIEGASLYKTIQPPCGRGNAFPLWWLAPPPFPPQAGALWMLSYGVMSLQESIERPILPPEQGEVRRSRIGGGERSEPIRRILIMPYDTESKSRNADFISIARRAIHHPQRRRRCRPLSEANTTRRRQAATTLGPEARQPSRERRPQRAHPNH